MFKFITEVHMKSKRIYMLAGILTLMVLGLGQAYAQGTCLSFIDRIPGITLDDAQKTTISAKETEQRKKMIQLKADHELALLDKDALLKDKNFKKDAVEKQVRKIMAIESDMEMAKLDGLDELRKVLTDEQWAMFSKHMGQRGPGMGKHCMGKASKGAHRMGNGPGMGSDDAPNRMGMKNCPYSGKAVQE